MEDDNPQVNPFDIRKECLVEGCYDTRLLVRYLNSHKVKLQLGVHKKWEELSVKVCTKDTQESWPVHPNDHHQQKACILLRPIRMCWVGFRAYCRKVY